MSTNYSKQNGLLLNNLMEYYKKNKIDNILKIINGESKISLRLIDWFATNYSKKYFTVYNLKKNNEDIRFKVYIDYKLKLKAYSKKRFDPFCRWERITIPYKENNFILETEHGPEGGDEINLIEINKINKDKIQNYGWPISSAGEHYGGKIDINKKKYEKYPLYKSHSKYGFIEPLK